MRVAPRFPRLAAILAVAAAIFSIAGASAHPHLWITVRCAFQFGDDGRLTGVVETWEFDEMYSALATVGIKRDDTGAMASLAGTIVASSKPVDHFTTATRGGKRLALGDPADIGASWRDGKLHVRFRLDLSEPQRLDDGEAFRIEVQDPDLFADFRFDRALDDAGLRQGCGVRIARPEDGLPSDPQARMQALIDGPLVSLKSGLEVTCGAKD